MSLSSKEQKVQHKLVQRDITVPRPVGGLNKRPRDWLVVSMHPHRRWYGCEPGEYRDARLSVWGRYRTEAEARTVLDRMHHFQGERSFIVHVDVYERMLPSWRD